MSEKPITYGLTTKKRVKERLVLTDPGLDTVIDRIIAAVTDMIESECGGRRFLQTTYTNEVYTIYHAGQKMLATKNYPIASISSLQYRAGLKSDPNWTDFNTDDWEIVNDGAAGLVRVYGLLNGVNLIRLTYVAGYKIDFENAGETSSVTHNLPYDLSDLAERLVVKIFKRRDNEGKQSETFEGATVQWKELLDTADIATINRYKRVPQFV